MRLIIFGAGKIGKIAFDYFGRGLIECFGDSKKRGVTKRKNVISFDEMISLHNAHEDILIVIASEKYWQEMKKQLVRAGVNRYVVFRELHRHGLYSSVPGYRLYHRMIRFSYTEILKNYDFKNINSIAIYGVYGNLQYLILELLIRKKDIQITIIKDFSGSDSSEYVGCPIKPFDDAVKGIDAMILNLPRNMDNIRDILQDYILDKDVMKFQVIDLFAMDKYEPLFVHKDLVQYKRMHEGKRCFIVGTGPSLRLEDLNLLHSHSELSISCNKIYRAYEKTEWRADYYVFCDGKCIMDSKRDISKIPGEIFCGDIIHYDEGNLDFEHSPENMHVFHYIEENYFPNCPGFSNDFVTGFYGGGTTTYVMLQLAAYMGFKEIYLLGIDHSVEGNCTDVENHFIKDYFHLEEKSSYENAVFRPEFLEKSYEKAEKYSRSHGFRIYNATRGGKLEIFERVDFDSLF